MILHCGGTAGGSRNRVRGGYHAGLMAPAISGFNLRANPQLQLPPTPSDCAHVYLVARHARFLPLAPCPGVFGAGKRAMVLAALALAMCVAASVRPALSQGERTGRRAALPSVLHLVDDSRTIRLPSGKRIARPVTTSLWYPPAADNGPWPLVVFGHGFATTPFRYRRLLRAWAAAGYLVAAPVFPLGNAHAPGGPDESDIVNQPRDMSFVISRLLAANASAASPLYGLVDPTRIAVAGQSDGAETAFATAYERPWHDPRVEAAVILSGAELGRHVRLVSRTAPLLAVQGTADRINPPVYTHDLFRAVDRPKFLLLLGHAGHLGPYTVPGPRLAAVERVSIAFLDHFLGTGSLTSLERAAARFRSDTLTSRP
jgi:dienelactone hydrolase